MVDILGLLRKNDAVKEEMDSLRQIEWETEYPKLLVQWFKDNNLYNTLRFLLPLIDYFTPNNNELKDNNKLYQRIMWILNKDIIEIQNELKYYPSKTPGLELQINPQEWIKLTDIRGQIPKPGEGSELSEKSKEILIKYTKEINELRNKFLKDLESINPTHKGGTIQTEKLPILAWNQRAKISLDNIDIDDDEISESIERTLSAIERNNSDHQPLDINAFSKIKTKPGYAKVSITTNGADLRKIMRSFRQIRSAKQMYRWNYNDEGTFLRNTDDDIDRNKELRNAKSHLDSSGLGRTKDTMIEVNERNTPIQIGWPQEKNPMDNFTNTWPLPRMLDGDELIGSLEGAYISDAPLNASYFNPVVSLTFFRKAKDQGDYTGVILNNRPIELPHLYIKVSNLIPDRFPSKEIARILNRATLNYINDLHALFIEDDYTKQITEIIGTRDEDPFDV
tara:strand:+ start:3352 stop:4704 length:1353 start_codon:yes stop_codon:yes gene_type:complete